MTVRFLKNRCFIKFRSETRKPQHNHQYNITKLLSIFVITTKYRFCYYQFWDMIRATHRRAWPPSSVSSGRGPCIWAAVCICPGSLRSDSPWRRTSRPAAWRTSPRDCRIWCTCLKLKDENQIEIFFFLKRWPLVVELLRAVKRSIEPEELSFLSFKSRFLRNTLQWFPGGSERKAVWFLLRIPHEGQHFVTHQYASIIQYIFTNT